MPAVHNGNIPTLPVAPQNIEAEQSTLAAMLLETPAIDKARAIVSMGDFYDPRHLTIFSVIADLTDRGTPADFITVKAELEARQAMDTIGLPYLARLLDTLPSAANVEYYARLVKDRAIQRRAWEWANRLAQAAGGVITDVASFLLTAQNDLERIGQAKPSLAPSRRKPLAERMLDLRDVPAPPAELPQFFGPYFMNASIHWITGERGIGKSTLLYNLLPAWAAGEPLWGIPSKKQRILYLDTESGDIGRRQKVQRLFADRPRPEGLLFACEPIDLSKELSEFLAYVKAQEITVVVFDTARRCFRVRDENDNAEVYNQIIPILDALKQMGIASIVMGHPAKNGFGARGAGSQEDAGDVNLELKMYRGDKNDSGGIVKLEVTKNRLLEYGIPDLLLRRLGNDRFEAVNSDQAGAPNVPTGAGLTALERAGQEIVSYLDEHQLGSATFSAIIEEMKIVGISESTAKRALATLRTQGIVKLSPAGVYILVQGSEAKAQVNPEP